MNPKRNNIKREIKLPKDLDDLLRDPLNDPNISLEFGFLSKWISRILEENLGDYYRTCYGSNGDIILKANRQREQSEPSPQLNLFG